MADSYIDIMIQSLKKKSGVLDELIRLNGEQRRILEDVEGDSDAFDEIVELKSGLIDQLENLDSGFDKLYLRTGEALRSHPDAYADEIKTMQEYIRQITDKSMKAQAQEARNKELMMQKFSRIKEQSRQVRANAKATTSYYQSMMRVNYVDPQFLDNKK